MTQLISCIKCGKSVSSKAHTCPKCGEKPGGVTCNVCRKNVAESNAIKDSERSWYHDIDGNRTGYDADLFYHEECLRKVSQVNHSCPVCSTPIHKVSQACPSCGQPFSSIKCKHCRQYIQEGFGLQNIVFEKPVHRICADIARPNWREIETKAKADTERKTIEQKRQYEENQKKYEEETRIKDKKTYIGALICSTFALSIGFGSSLGFGYLIKAVPMWPWIVATGVFLMVMSTLEVSEADSESVDRGLNLIRHETAKSISGTIVLWIISVVLQSLLGFSPTLSAWVSAWFWISIAGIYSFWSVILVYEYTLFIISKFVTRRNNLNVLMNIIFLVVIYSFGFTLGLVIK